MSLRPPKYRLHKPSGLAVVTIGGKHVYLGKHGSEESKAEYARLIAEWASARRAGRPSAASGPAPMSGLSVNELILAYVRFADGYDVKDSEPTAEPANIRFALRPLRRLYGLTPAAEFGPLASKGLAPGDPGVFGQGDQPMHATLYARVSTPPCGAEQLEDVGLAVADVDTAGRVAQ